MYLYSTHTTWKCRPHVQCPKNILLYTVPKTKKMGQFWKLIIGKLLKNETGNLEFLLRKAKKVLGMENKPSMNETDKKVA